MRTMKTTLSLFAVSSVFLLGACHNDRADVADNTEVVAPSNDRVYTDAETTKTAPVVRRTTPNTGSPAIETRRATTTLPADDTAITGIAACDDYLSSYKRCHAVAGVYRPELIDSRYDETRNALVKQAHDPSLSADLDKRCESLASDLKEVLDGKDCLPAEQPVTPVASTDTE